MLVNNNISLGGAGIVSGPQQAAEQREVINSIEAQVLYHFYFIFLDMSQVYF